MFLDPYTLKQDNTAKSDTWCYGESAGIEIYFAAEKDKSGKCVGLIPWRVVRALLEQKEAK